MARDVWQRLHDGEVISMREDQEFRDVTIPEMARSLGLCTEINKSNPYDAKTRELIQELLEGNLPDTSNILASLEIDYGHQLKIKDKVFINHSFCVSAAAGVEIDEGVQIAPPSNNFLQLITISKIERLLNVHLFTLKEMLGLEQEQSFFLV